MSLEPLGGAKRGRRRRGSRAPLILLHLVGHVLLGQGGECLGRGDLLALELRGLDHGRVLQVRRLGENALFVLAKWFILIIAWQSLTQKLLHCGISLRMT